MIDAMLGRVRDSTYYNKENGRAELSSSAGDPNSHPCQQRCIPYLEQY